METKNRFRANSLASSSVSSGSRPGTPNNSILYDLLTQKDDVGTMYRIKMATLSNDAGYSGCIRTLTNTIKFILDHPIIDALDMQTKLAIIERNWLSVFLIDLAMSNIELHFGEITMTVPDHQMDQYINRPTKETAVQLAHCLNCIRNQQQNGFGSGDIDLIKELCLLQNAVDVPRHLLDEKKVVFGQILLSISKLQKVDTNQLSILLFGSISRPITMLLSALRR